MTSSLLSPMSFNSRSREGSDGRGATQGGTTIHVSIHAPVKGATQITVKALLPDGFQFTLP